MKKSRDLMSFLLSRHENPKFKFIQWVWIAVLHAKISFLNLFFASSQVEERFDDSPSAFVSFKS